MPPPRPTHPARALALLSLAPVLAATLLVASARWFWVGELAASLAFHLGLACFAVCALCLVVRRLGLAVVALALGLVHAGPELALSVPRSASVDATDAPPGAPAEVELTLATANLLWSNRDPAGFVRWLAEHEPDVVLLQEISPERRAVLAALDEYPYLYLSPAPESWTPFTWGTGILSRHPLESARELPTAFGMPPVEAVLRIGGARGPRLTVRGVHTCRPGRAWRIRQRNEVLDALARETWGATSVLAGDLNAPSTSPVFRRLVRASGLRDSRRGFGRQPTFVLKGLLPLAIDHVLVGRDVRVVSRATSELPGSDHRAVLVRLALPAGAP